MRTIRRARSKDAAAIQDLYIQLNTLSVPAVSPDRIANLEKSDNTFLLVCEDDGKTIASALVCLCDDVMFQNQPFAVVENVIVSEEHQREGVGKSLMNYIEDLCLQHDCSKIVLQTGSKNHSARDFYTAAGYDPDKKIGFIKYRRYFGQ